MNGEGGLAGGLLGAGLDERSEAMRGLASAAQGETQRSVENQQLAQQRRGALGQLGGSVGGLAGAVAGSAVLPGAGTAIGGVIGSLAGAFGSRLF